MWGWPETTSRLALGVRNRYTFTLSVIKDMEGRTEGIGMPVVCDTCGLSADGGRGVGGAEHAVADHAARGFDHLRNRSE